MCTCVCVHVHVSVYMHLLPMQLLLVDKTDVSWWSMRSAEGVKGLVPVNYIEKWERPSPPTRAAPPPRPPPPALSPNTSTAPQRK